MRTTLLWLFAADIFHQLLFYFGGVAATVILIWDKAHEKPLQWRWVFSFFLFCLFVSCVQAWIDEHHNSEQLISEKADLSARASYWEGQNSRKDEAIRARDQLVLKGLQTSSETQQTANRTQESLTQLAAKVFEVTKPEPVRISSKVMLVQQAPNSPPGSPTGGILVASTNRRIASFSGRISCASAFAIQNIQMLQGVMGLSPAAQQAQGQTHVDLDFSSGAWDSQQPIVAIIYGDPGFDPLKCVLTER